MIESELGIYQSPYHGVLREGLESKIAMHVKTRTKASFLFYTFI